MKVLNINAVYGVASTGRTIKEMHEFFVENGIESYIAATNVRKTDKNFYKIGNRFDYSLHALLSRLFGLQGYFSLMSTIKLCRFISKISPDVVVLHNIHSNYLNYPYLLKYFSKKSTRVVFVLHDSWFYTGRCVYYCEDNCYKWQEKCGKCPALKKGNVSLFFDRSKKMLLEKKKLYSKLKKYGVVGVSKWVTDDAKKSIFLKPSSIDYIYNWIPFEHFNENAKSDFRKLHGLENKIVILCVAANWNSQKGYDLILELSQIITEEMSIVIVGSCNNLKKSPRIVYLDNISNVDELAGIYACSDVFLNPSVQETFGKTTAEAMSCGTPVVLFNNTASPELIGEEGKCGFFIPKHTSQSILEIIQKVTSKPKSFYSKECLKRSRELFDKKTNILKYVSIFDQLCEDK
ncbi:MAG: glycosyltransferase [Bacilli bacterium]|nr:glycosyltransferase [Bacilli bacterium]